MSSKVYVNVEVDFALRSDTIAVEVEYVFSCSTYVPSALQRILLVPILG